MVEYGLTGRVAIITGANNPQGIGAATAQAFAREGAKVVLVYQKIPRAFDESKTDRNGADRYFAANAGNAETVERTLQAMGADVLVLERDISNENDSFYCRMTERNRLTKLAFATEEIYLKNQREKNIKR